MHEKKDIFCRTECVAMTPKSRDHMPTTSIWGVAAKWPTRAPKTKLVLILIPERPTRIQPYQFEPVRQDFERVPGTSCQLRSKPHAVFHGGLRNRTHWSARYTYGRDTAQQESKKIIIKKKSETSDSFVNHFDGHFAYLKNLGPLL